MGGYVRGRSLSQRLYDNCVPEPNTGCWLWIGAVNNQGYGQIGVENRKKALAHRMMWQAERGAIPTGMCVMHICDNGHLGCVNPAHLTLGTKADNAADMVRKGRHAKQVLTACKKGHPYKPGSFTIFPSSPRERRCLICHRARGRAYLLKKRTEQAGVSP